MTISTLAFGKASASGSHRTASSARRLYSTAPAPAPKHATTNGIQHQSTEFAAQRELFMNVLNANATRRDAKQYLARFESPRPAQSEHDRLSARHWKDQDRLQRVGVNLGGLYSPARAIADSPQFVQLGVQHPKSATPQQRIHVALVCLRMAETLDDATLDGVALTLSQLVKLDMRIVVVLDGPISANPSESVKGISKTIAEQGGRLTKAIAMHSPEGGRLVTGALETGISAAGYSKMTTYVGSPSLLLDPLKRSVIPIVPATAYTRTGQLVYAGMSSIMPALTTMLSGLPTSPDHDENGFVTTSLDRIIVLDPAGGIPSRSRGGGAHIFINLEQEYKDIMTELTGLGEVSDHSTRNPCNMGPHQPHQVNLSMLRECLIVLPSESSALIITPQDAASSSQTAGSDETTTGAGTRRQKNTLIHNLLTNKPSVSSSLPAARMPAPSSSNGGTTLTTMAEATVVKRGMPLTIVPVADGTLGWQLPHAGKTTLTLEDDPRVDFPRLLHLIEDSFRRKLDVRHYLDRIRGRIAGLIVAGSYEGGAILTWEQPPGTDDPARLVPYLDKFAVLSSSQGSSGVADIVFQAMVRTCFPQGVCWRSRKDNPVNKWYFERSDGTWQIPETNWTMFWTGQDVVNDQQKFNDYVGVCRDVKPSWADGRKPD